MISVCFGSERKPGYAPAITRPLITQLDQSCGPTTSDTS
jgi:hypothetical protein